MVDACDEKLTPRNHITCNNTVRLSRFTIWECPKSCNICRHSMERKIKCQRDPAEPPILQSPGGLNKMMRAIVNNAHIKEKYNTTVILEDPWILQFDNFATRDHWDWLENELRDKVSSCANA
jgi:hypothetical protein